MLRMQLFDMLGDIIIPGKRHYLAVLYMHSPFFTCKYAYTKKYALVYKWESEFMMWNFAGKSSAVTRMLLGWVRHYAKMVSSLSSQYGCTCGNPG